jgi:GT2 family glycosyltransferase
MNPLIFIVILNWNGRTDTLACLESIAAVDYDDLRVIVADNGSIDGSVDAIRLSFPWVEVVDNGANLGFADGNNSAIRYALDSGADFIALVNNDTVVDPKIVSAFVVAADRLPDCGVFGAKIYYYDRKDVLWYAGGYWDPETLSFGEYGAGEHDMGQYDTLTETEWVIGCAMFIRAEVFKKVGLLEPAFFLNNEEIDFCSRSKRAGFRCAYVPEAKLWHKISVSFGGEDSPMKEYFSARNRLLWAQRNAAFGLRMRIYLSSTRALLRRFVRPMLGFPMGGRNKLRQWWWSARAAFRDPRNRAAAMGYRDFWLRRFGNCPDVVRDLAREWKARRTAEPAVLPGTQTR